MEEKIKDYPLYLWIFLKDQKLLRIQSLKLLFLDYYLKIWFDQNLNLYDKFIIIFKKIMLLKFVWLFMTLMFMVNINFGKFYLLKIIRLIL